MTLAVATAESSAMVTKEVRYVIFMVMKDSVLLS